MVRRGADARLRARSVEVARHVELAMMGESNGLVAIHDVGHALSEPDQRPFRFVRPDDLPVLVAHQRIWKAEALAETIARLLIVGRNPDDVEAGRSQSFVFPTEPVGLFRSKRSECFRKEEDDDVASVEHLVKSGGADAKVGGTIAWVQHGHKMGQVRRGGKRKISRLHGWPGKGQGRQWPTVEAEKL